jgi:Zn-dependent protease
MSIAGYISSRELKDLLISLAALVIAFSVLMGGRKIPGMEMVLIIALGVGTGFLLHEMAHKFVALHFGYLAEYRANMTGLLLAVVLSFAGFIFAAPGAVMISKPRAPAEFYQQDSFGQAELIKQIKNESLWISLAGPITNIALAAAFFIVLLLSTPDGIAARAANFGLIINLTLAAFNLLPFGPLDGKKIFESNRIVWFIVGLPTILLGLSVYLRMI